MLPCHHQAVCNECSIEGSSSLLKCPICMKAVLLTKVKEEYYSGLEQLTKFQRNFHSCKAIFSYQPAQADDELSFKEGDIILSKSKDPAGWWERTLNVVIGNFPSNYTVEI